ncbi:hypothetical protein CAPTEDRAFT_189157 [Capitella teleta]|uniref:Uncharacterized protein n=1 Tax=Capitella teleta TaxID=283909 RepID=R7UQ65_CAPTE|nr:hypothetical protein CAPTEDRAFT_189157 [Capitella teleta]|eukprot:ELU08253.1 hypothetical protein CAPTEDRAFT_189157 [Capitella teleta]
MQKVSEDSCMSRPLVIFCSLLFAAVLLPRIEAHFHPRCFDYDCLNPCVADLRINVTDRNYTCMDVCIEPKGCPGLSSSDATITVGRQTTCVETKCFDGCVDTFLVRYDIPIDPCYDCITNGACK